MAQDRITLQIRAFDGAGDILLSDFNKEVEAFARTLEHADVHLSGRGRRTIEFRVIGLHHSTATVEIGATPIEGEDDVRNTVADEFFSGLREIMEYARAPKNFTIGLVGALRDMAAPVGFGVAETLISWGDHSANISVAFKKRIQDVLLPDDVEAGDASGMMEMVNIHAKENRFRLYPIIGPSQINCEFDDDKLPSVKEGLGKYVIVSGTLYYRYGEKYPYRMDVANIEIPDDENELPTFADLKGVAPNLTRGVPSELFIRQVRDEWE